MSIQDMEQAAGFSWLDPHPVFVMVFVGPDETPFGIQQNFLCAKSSYFRNYFKHSREETLEHIVRLPQFSDEVFGLAQNFMYTGRLTDTATQPGYDILIATWKLGHYLDIEGLCDTVLDAMTECRRITSTIPATPLLIQVWNDTPEGSEIRKLLLTWAAEYIRSSDSRAEFSKSLPQGLLSDLVIVMSHLNSDPSAQTDNNGPTAKGDTQHKNVHYLDTEEDGDSHKDKVPKHRHSDAGLSVPVDAKFKADRKPRARVSLPTIKPVKFRKTNGNSNSDSPPTKGAQLVFCADLLNRMLSGPGFWTRLVGPFRERVRPVEDGVPDYLDKVTKPMDLGTIKKKMDENGYNDAHEFAEDVRQIFANVYTYWSEKDPMWATVVKFQRTFEEKYAGMNKWITKYDGEEPI